MKTGSNASREEQGHCAHTAHVCPRSGRGVFRTLWFPLAGLISLIWFLIRVIPKPSRASYPCQRAAAPLAASFVVWICGMLGTAFAYRKWRIARLHRRTVVAAMCAAAAIAAGVVTVGNMPRAAKAGYPAFHAPIGVPQGIHPGRVVWVYNPGATDWAGYSSSDRWYDDSHTDPAVVERMVSQSIRGIAGKSTDAEAWDAIFRYYNQKHGRGDRGYVPGEKILIKLNMVDCNIATGNVSLSTWDKLNTNAVRNKIAVAPQMIRALLKHLVYTVGVSQSNITLGDSTAYWPNCYLTQIRNEYPNVVFEQNGYGYTSAAYRTKATFSSSPFNWSTPDAVGKTQDYLPTSCAQADYLINFTTLKGHSAGVTLCGKNHYGSLIRLPNGKLDGVDQGYYFMHQSLPNPAWSPGVGRYRAIVDLMGHPGLGGKTLLYLIDGLYGGYYSESIPYKWNMTPFNGDWPSSLLVSQDPVAIDSVGYDFLKAEWPNIVANGVYAGPDALQGGAEDYMHEAALAYDPPSGVFYDPDKDGVRMQSLGVHEHWNDSTHKQYSGNLGQPNGITLLTLRYDSGSIQRAKRCQNETSALVCGATITAAFTDYFYIESDDREFGIRVDKTSHGLSVGTRVNVAGLVRTNADGERYIYATKISLAGTGAIAPVFVTGKDLGGGNWEYDPNYGAGQKGITGAHGVNNIGLLVKLSGEVIERDTTQTPPFCRVRDGSGISVKVTFTSSGLVPALNTRVSVKGISSCETVGVQVLRVLRAVGGAESW